MSAPQPLTDDELAAIKARAHYALHGADQSYRCREMVRADVPRLVAEVERLRAKVGGYFGQAALDERLAQNEGGALLRVQALHADDGTGACGWCDVEWPCATAAAATP